MNASLSRLATACGWACTTIGAYHFAFGVSSVPGEQDAGATVDSRERFYAALFAGYGFAWLRAGRQDGPEEAQALAALMTAGGAGRVLSLAHKGSPHWFQNVLTAVEFAFPATVYVVAARERSS